MITDEALFTHAQAILERSGFERSAENWGRHCQFQRMVVSTQMTHLLCINVKVRDGSLVVHTAAGDQRKTDPVLNLEFTSPRWGDPSLGDPIAWLEKHLDVVLGEIQMYLLFEGEV